MAPALRGGFFVCGSSPTVFATFFLSKTSAYRFTLPGLSWRFFPSTDVINKVSHPHDENLLYQKFLSGSCNWQKSDRAYRTGLISLNGRT
jgi:hypothetical protein